ncbi:conserved hypothetical protein [Neospora caninum Liverpool]|uniref:Transmembrane protein n=1 Tax=Neospora caninum (strain Liverpool) TaxID=572307 RepID=F0VIT2_NEOCL|nr:conserved hypothetical protein [Neospora caninum Liverpool]CBZ53643.1 conserved hypothetical protein [Neospora caninum Liverpool]CEL67634.1 TPA: hypothetical protein BN1204_034290 [Neospora caninum Liverpool]|eukprot:XP_003883675.1 conserved hypothetical protein [Neospora caninum Liverpool]
MRRPLVAFVTVAACLPGLAIGQTLQVQTTTLEEETPVLRDTSQTAEALESISPSLVFAGSRNGNDASLSTLTADFEDLASRDDITDLVRLLERANEQLRLEAARIQSGKKKAAFADNILARITTRKEFAWVKETLNRGTVSAKEILSQLKARAADMSNRKEYLWIKQQLNRSSSALRSFFSNVKARSQEVRSRAEFLRMKKKFERGAIKARATISKIKAQAAKLRHRREFSRMKKKFKHGATKARALISKMKERAAAVSSREEFLRAKGVLERATTPAKALMSKLKARAAEVASRKEFKQPIDKFEAGRDAMHKGMAKLVTLKEFWVVVTLSLWGRAQVMSGTLHGVVLAVNVAMMIRMLSCLLKTLNETSGQNISVPESTVGKTESSTSEGVAPGMEH